MSAQVVMVDFKKLFESAPGLFLVLEPGSPFRIVAVSDAYLLATLQRREQILGRGLFEVFPDNPDDSAASGTTNLRASLMRVIENKAPDTMAVQKYDIPRPASEGGGFEERFWSPINSPVLGSGGELTHLIHRVEDVTDFVRKTREGALQDERSKALQERNDRMTAEIVSRSQELDAANRKLRAALQDLSSPILLLKKQVLVLPLIGVFDAARADQVKVALLQAIRDHRARFVIIDVTGVPTLDSTVAAGLVQSLAAARLMGARMLLTGISADAASTLVGWDFNLENVSILGDLAAGIAEVDLALSASERLRSAPRGLRAP